jgi:hypothetical protein
VAPLTIATEVLREGRKIQLCGVKLLANGVQVVGATVLKIKRQALTLPDEVKALPVTLPSPEDSLLEDGHAATSPFVRSVSMRAARGRFGQAGAGAIWFRVDHPLIAGEALSQAMRAVVAADFSNGTASTLDFRTWTYINADLTVSFRASRSVNGSCSTAIPGSVLMVPGSRCRGSPTGRAISAARCKVW